MIQDPAPETTAALESASETRRWYQGIPRYAWLVLALAAMGWLFDAMDQNLFTLVRQASVRELLEGTMPAAALDAQTKVVGTQITAIFLLGWAFGGFLFGILGDRLGRSRTMVITILIYAAFTGLNGLVQTPWQYALCRFLTALGVGGEFAAGASLVAEVWPARSRPIALGLLQASSAFGNMAAAVTTLVLSAVSWRWAFVVGAAPALLALWVRVAVREPEKWQKAREEAIARTADGSPKELGNIASLFSDPTLRRNTIAGVLLALAGVGGLWGVGFFLPDLVGSALKPLIAKSPEVLSLPAYKQAALIKTLVQAARSKVFIVQQIGAFLGMFCFAPISEKIGRRPTLFVCFILAFGAVEGTFWGLHDFATAYFWAGILGFCAFAPFSAYAVYFPELYPTRLRATGVGFCYNCARVLAALAPFALGSLAKMYASPTDETAGLRVAASIVAFIYVAGFAGLALAPETRGKPLPE